MVNRRQLLKLSFLGFATFTVASVAPSSVRGDGLRKQFVDLDLSVKGFSDRETSVWEFADLVTVRPSSNPSTWDWTPAVQALLNRGGKVLLPKNIIYTVNATLRMKSNTWLVINGTLKFADQKNTLSNEHLLMCGDIGDPRVNIYISGVGTLDGNCQKRQSFAPTSGAYLFLARETTKLRILPGLKFINAPSSAITGVECTDVVVAGADIRFIREHGIYFSTSSKDIRIAYNTLNDLAADNMYCADAVKLRNNCSGFLICGNTLNKSALLMPNTVRGIVLDDSGNVSPVNHAICRDGVILENTMLGLSTGIWFKGALINAAAPDSDFEMRVEVLRNFFEAKSSSSLFAGILDRVRKVSIGENIWRGFSAGIYGGGVGDITLRGNKIMHSGGVSGDGIRMLDTLYNDTTIASRARGDVTLVGNEVAGYDGVGALLTVANARDELKKNKIVSTGRAISYRDYGLSTAPIGGCQKVDLSDNPLLTSTGIGVTAVFLSARPEITVQYRVTHNNISSAAVGIAYSVVQNSLAMTNKIDAPTPLSVDSTASVYQEGNYSSGRLIKKSINHQ